jgi:enoyl-CoA hydratase/carnithine racemase
VTFEHIGYEVADRVATITLDRPEALNALNPAMIRELRRAYDDAEADDDVWTLLVTGTGRAFCTGADVGEITMTKPVVVAVNGICCGAGLDWVTTGDIVLCSDRATFFDPHVSIGLVSGREVVRLARALPTHIAMRMALMGRHERMSAERAYELGLVSEVVVHDRLLERAREITATVNRNAPLAVRGTRLAIRRGLDLPMYEAEVLAEAMRERVVRTDDAKEGPRAFMEKREPRWTCR